MIKVYKLNSEYYLSDVGEYIIISESGTWEHERLKIMMESGVIRWLYHDGPAEAVTNFGRIITTEKYPYWLRCFLSKYSWTFNDPISWKQLDGGRTITIEHKWELNSD